MSKKVYILGAGASRAVNAPLQSELLYKVFDININEDSFSGDNFMNLSYNIPQRLLASYSIFKNDRVELANFIIENFGTQKLIESAKYCDTDESWKVVFEEVKNLSISLEDLFTILDKITHNNEHFRFYNTKYINKIRTSLNRCIIYTLAFSLDVDGKNFELYEKLSNHLVDKRLQFNQSDDPFCIITLNWDTIIDKYIYRACYDKNKIYENTGVDKRILPDYCFYNHYFQPLDTPDFIPSFHVKAKGNYNIKILKLHGSMNWLLCPRCNRMFIDYEKNIALEEMVYTSRSTQEKLYCRFCSNIYDEKLFDSEEIYSNPKLKTLLITPTFLKELNNIHLKNIWHNAHIDLSEANEVVFIGYSFPDADFEIRYLLKKAISPTAKIRVILVDSDNPNTYKDTFKQHYDMDSVVDLVARLNLPPSRYENFFGKGNVEFNYNGLEGLIENDI